jgi:hypothetical protein
MFTEMKTLIKNIGGFVWLVGQIPLMIIALATIAFASFDNKDDVENLY